MKGCITVVGQGSAKTARSADVNNNQVIYKRCTSFTNYISQINNAKIDNVKDLDVVMAMYNLVEYSNNYAKTSRSLWQYYIDELTHNITDSKSFKFKSEFIDKTDNAGTVYVKTAVLLKCLSNFLK